MCVCVCVCTHLYYLLVLALSQCVKGIVPYMSMVLGNLTGIQPCSETSMYGHFPREKAQKYAIQEMSSQQSCTNLYRFIYSCKNFMGMPLLL